MKAWKVQKFFGDVVYDLRNRGLLPVVILLGVAMVAVPIAISRGSSDSSAPSIQSPGGFTDLAPEAEAAVLAYNPGIRDYKKRLDSLSPKDPFRQQFAKSAETASQLNSTAPAPTPTGGGSSDAVSTGSTTVSGGGSGTKKKKKKKSAKTTYSDSVTVFAGDVSTTLTPFKDVASLTPLPSQTTPVIVYYGLSSDHTLALFLVSNRADQLNGPGACLPAPDDCSLLALAAGQSEDLHYGLDDKTYRVIVSEIKRIAK